MKAFKGMKTSQASFAIDGICNFACFDFIYVNFKSVFWREYGTLIHWSEFMFWTLHIQLKHPKQQTVICYCFLPEYAYMSQL